MDIDHRDFPHSLEAERAVLGAIMLSPAAWHEAASVLQPADFYRAVHGTVFSVMAELSRDGTAIDLLTLKDRLLRRGQLDEVGGPAYIAKLVDGVPRTTNVLHYARIIRDNAKRRAGMQFASNLASDLRAGLEPTPEIVDAAVRHLLASVDVSGEESTTAADVVRKRYHELSTDTRVAPIPTGYADLDRLITGVRRRNLTIVAARPSAGKTAFGLGLGANVAATGHGVLWCSLEQPKDELADRIMAWDSGVSIRDIEHGDAEASDYVVLAAAMEQVRDTPLYLIESARTLTQIAAWIHRLRGLGHRVDVVVIDYIQKMLAERREDSRNTEVAAISDGLTRIAKELDVAMVALSQLKRPQAGKADKRPQMSDMRESGALEQDASTVLLIYREEMYKPKPDNDGLAEIIVAKNRSGPIGVQKLYFQKRLAKFVDLAV
jgi:replicative DNA helicase